MRRRYQRYSDPGPSSRPQRPNTNTDADTSKNYDTPLTSIDIRDIQTGDYLTVNTREAVYIMQIVSKSPKGELFVKILFGQNALRFEYAGIQNIFITEGQPLILDNKEGRCVNTSGVQDVVVSKSYPDALKNWEIEVQRLKNETIQYNVDTDDVKTNLLQIGDFVHINTQNGYNYILLVVDTNISHKRIVRIVSSNDPNMIVNVRNLRIINNILKKGTPLFLDGFKDGSSPVTGIRITKVNFKTYGKEEPKDDKNHDDEKTPPPGKEKVNPSAPAFSYDEIEALRCLGIGECRPENLSETVIRRAFQKMALKWHNDKKDEDAEEFIRTRVMQMLGEAKETLLKRFS